MIRNLIKKSADIRARTLFAHLGPLLPKNGTLLDFGCGIGYFGYQVGKQTDCRLTYLDVKSYPFMNPEIRLQCYDGVTIPFPDDSFDYSMAVFTLHHTRNAKDCLKELVRVTRKQLIVSEDFIASPSHKYTEAVKDWVANCFMGSITMQYKQDAEWESLYSELGLTMVRKIHFSSSFLFLPFKHVVWVLDKNPSSLIPPAACR